MCKAQISDRETGKEWSMLWKANGDEKSHWEMDVLKMPAVSDDAGKGLRNRREVLETSTWRSIKGQLTKILLAEVLWLSFLLLGSF